MGQNLLLAQIVAILENVSGIGVVYDYERKSRSFAEWTILMSHGGIINAWTVTRFKTETDRETIATVMNRHQFKIKGYYKVNDVEATEGEFQALVDAVQLAFKNNALLNGAAYNSEPVTVDIVTTKELAPDYAVHYAELTMQAEEREWI